MPRSVARTEPRHKWWWDKVKTGIVSGVWAVILLPWLGPRRATCLAPRLALLLPVQSVREREDPWARLWVML